MRTSIHWISSIFLTLVALSVFLFAFTASFAVSTGLPPGFAYDYHDFGLHGGVYQVSRSSGLLPNSIQTNTNIQHSLNWAGFYVGTGSGNGFKQVTGNWSTPCISGTVNSNHLDAQWVGIGGVYGNQSLLQVGTALLTDGRFHPFYELYPNPPIMSTQGFACANAFTASVDYNLYSKGTNKNHIYIKNLSTGFTLNYVVPNSRFKPDLRSAEWIDERPSCNSGLSDLANFHYVTWTNARASMNMASAVLSGISSFPNNALIMQDKNHSILAKPDGLGANNTFKDRWYNTGRDGSC